MWRREYENERVRSPPPKLETEYHATDCKNSSLTWGKLEKKRNVCFLGAQARTSICKYCIKLVSVSVTSAQNRSDQACSNQDSMHMRMVFGQAEAIRSSPTIELVRRLGPSLTCLTPLRFL